MRLFRSFGTARRLVAFTSLLAALGVLAGAATIGRAATTNPVTATFKVLNDSENGLIPGQPSPGGNIGYALTGQNTSTSAVNHFTFSETIGAGGTVVYLDYHGVSCSGKGTAKVSCSLKQLTAGTTFDVTALFSTDSAAAPGSPLVNTVVATFDSQTPNGSNKRTTDTFAPCDGTFDPSQTTSPCAVTRSYAGNTDGSLAESLSLKNEGISAGGAQTSSITMPPGFVNSFNFVGTRLENFNGADAAKPANCPSCLPFRTKVTIPPAASFGNTGPFLDANNNADPYVLSFTVPATSNFKPLGAFHSESDNGADGFYLDACQLNPDGTPIAPTSSPGLCTWKITTQKGKAGVVFYTYWVVGVVNGSNYGG
jgi:hypothetical protein